MTLWLIVFILLILMSAVWIVIAVMRSRYSVSQKSNVIQFSKKRRSSIDSDIIAPGNQKCSKCNRAKELIFYSNDWGQVAGLCKDCRKEIGDQQELYPI
ncbi:hypothetical protein [Paenibacillus lentus]|uniref:Uncharacterized protein n=1 Tax=Paenibacillus lentus TaxID=1338368 RepID=A0A3Q8SC74_9BACL|nr:hypothetical protein [Paenibacillus lentus]AZK47367.1 hypothetical protein EIM92_15390 [Paenibacillus lentus]